MACQEADNYLLVAAIDFGTTYSGYAYSTRQNFAGNRLQIVANQVWNAGAKQLLSLKTPTCILLNKKDQELVSFGYEAENAYAEIVENSEEDDYYYFQQFKMVLYYTKDLNLNTPLKDVRGKPLPAVKVFAAGIKALKDHLDSELKSKSIDIRPDEIKWVLTVPAIWSDQAKQFMRESAKLAGIDSKNLVISLEPENASIYCQLLTPENLVGCQQGFSNIQKGTKYIVVDLGGGTVDITAHEKVGENKMAELCKATGNDCGGSSVDKQFMQVIEDIIGKTLMDKIAKEDVESHLDLCRSFETIKRNLHTHTRPRVNITFPFVALDGFCKSNRKKDFGTLLSESRHSDKIKLNKDKLNIDIEFLKSLFQTTIANIISLIKNVLSQGPARQVRTILLVGGFSECQLVRQAVLQEFSDKTVISPEEPSLAIMKGAVLYGHMPNFIDSRISRRTYGRRIKPVFDSSVHDQSRKETVDEQDRCRDVFEAFMTINESIPVGKKVKLEYHTIQKRQDKVNVAIYVTEKSKLPTYVDEEGVKKIGEFVVEIPEPTDERRYVIVQFTFGETELKAKAIEKESQRQCRATLNLL